MKYNLLIIPLFFLNVPLFSQISIRLMEKGNSMIDSKNPREAIVYYDSLITLYKNYTDAYFNRARAKNLSGDHLGAIKDLDMLISIDTTDYEAFFYRGFIKYEKENVYNSSSLSDYDKALRINPNYGLAYSYRGIFKMREGNLEEALKDCNLGVNKMPDNKFCYFNRGEVKRRMEDYKGAILDYQKVIELDSAYYPALFGIITCKEKTGDYNGAVECYSSLLKLYPERPLLFLDIGKVKLKANNKEGACEDFEKAKLLGCGAQQEEVEKLIKKNCKRKK